MVQANLVIQTAFLGDLILSIPTLNRIKTLHPEKELGIVCKKGLGEFLLAEHVVDFVVEVEKSNGESYKAALNNIQNFEIENLYCLHRSVRSQLFSSQIKAHKKIGFSSFFGFWVFDDLVHYEIGLPEVLRQLKILESTDSEVKKKFLDDQLVDLNKIDMPIPDFFSFPKKLNSGLGSRRIGIFPGSVWVTKRWTVAGFQTLVNLFVEAGYEVDLLGAPDEKALCEEISSARSHVKIRAGEFSISQSIKNIGNYAAIVANDSAPTHMATYAGTPVVTIFGPTTSKMGFRPWGNSVSVVEDVILNCRPCGPHGHAVCPLGHHNCMKNITADLVFKSVLSLLQK